MVTLEESVGIKFFLDFILLQTLDISDQSGDPDWYKWTDLQAKIGVPDAEIL